MLFNVPGVHEGWIWLDLMWMGLQEALGNGSLVQEKRAVVAIQSCVKARTAQGTEKGK